MEEKSECGVRNKKLAAGGAGSREQSSTLEALVFGYHKKALDKVWLGDGKRRMSARGRIGG